MLVFALLIVLVFNHSERTLRDRIEVDLERDAQLLESISTGTFLGSKSGRYLQSLRDRFSGERLADMLCCLRLHGELALRAKGLLLLRETGMAEPPLDAESRDKLAELAQLERSIGKAGMLALRPLMMASGKNVWQLTLLGRQGDRDGGTSGVHGRRNPPPRDGSLRVRHPPGAVDHRI